MKNRILYVITMLVIIFAARGCAEPGGPQPIYFDGVMVSPGVN